MSIKRLFFLIFCFIFASCLRGATEEIDLTTGQGGILVLSGIKSAPQGEQGIIYSSTLKLPSFNRGCYMMRDKRKWPSTGNGMFGAVFGRSALPLLEEKDIMPGMKGVSWEGTMLLLELQNGGYLCVLPLTSELSMGWLYLEVDGTFSIQSGTFGKEMVNGNVPLLAWGRSDDIYRAIRDAWQQAYENEQISRLTAPREEKAYPDVFRYLGWCSWEQYKKKIDGNLLVETAEKIEQSAVPVRWMLVDDGHQEASANLMELVSFNPDPEKFPEEWKPLIAKRSEDKIKWFGLWHCFKGLWNNISLSNKLVGFENDLMPSKDGETLIVKDETASIDKFYRTMIETVKQQGFDFVKIDVQSLLVNEYEGHANPVKTSVASSEALEDYCHRQLGNGLINCMTQSPANMFTRKYSSVSRVSLDYQLGNKAKAVSHIHQSYMTTLYQGQSVWPDHDMFHSNDPVSGELMAISKAMSGGPVYLSDAVDNFVPENILPLCYSDGELLRPLAPAVPLPSSVFDEFLDKPNLYYAIAPLSNGAAAIVAYNLNYPESTTIRGKVSILDYCSASAMIRPYPGKWEMPDEGLVVFDWKRQKGQALQTDYSFTLTGFSDKLLLLCPVRQGWAVVGRSDKFLSPAAVKTIRAETGELHLELEESGPLVIWQDSGRPHSEGVQFEDLGNGFWKCDLPVGKKDYSMMIKSIKI